MPIEVFLMVLGAALVHATWNALVKADGSDLRLEPAVSSPHTLLDGLGARASGSAHGYTAWLSLISCSLITAAITWLQRRNGSGPVTRRTRIAGITSGLASYASTWTIIWAMTVVPVPLVSALRETSIIFAVVIGVVVLKERLNLARLASIAATLVGTAILKFSR